MSTITALPASLTGLTPREAITDAIQRAVECFDRNSASLLRSAYTSTATFDLNGTISSGISAITTDVLGKVGHLDTTHTVTGIRIEYNPKKDADRAYATATAVAQHFRKGEGMKMDATRLLAGSLYEIELVKVDGKEEEEGEEREEGLWKVEKFKMKIIWAEGDFGVFA